MSPFHSVTVPKEDSAKPTDEMIFLESHHTRKQPVRPKHPIHQESIGVSAGLLAPRILGQNGLSRYILV